MVGKQHIMVLVGLVALGMLASRNITLAGNDFNAVSSLNPDHGYLLNEALYDTVSDIGFSSVAGHDGGDGETDSVPEPWMGLLLSIGAIGILPGIRRRN